jgi:hypothetical protein
MLLCADTGQDNDRLHFKIQQAKRSLQRMKLERACVSFIRFLAFSDCQQDSL